MQVRQFSGVIRNRGGGDVIGGGLQFGSRRRIWKLMSRRAGLFVTTVVAAVILAFIAAGASSGQPDKGTVTNLCPNILEATPDVVALGSSGQISFACGFDLPVPAFTVSRTNVKAIPHFPDFGSPYQSLWIYRADGSPDGPTTGPCHERGGPAKQLHQGERLTIPGQKDWNYCAEYVDVGPTDLSGFQVTWEAA